MGACAFLRYPCPRPSRAWSLWELYCQKVVVSAAAKESELRTAGLSGSMGRESGARG